jgi:hypothetical protein
VRISSITSLPRRAPGFDFFPLNDSATTADAYLQGGSVRTGAVLLDGPLTPSCPY